MASSFLETYRGNHPDTVIETLDLWDGSLPQFGPTGASAKMAVWSGGTRRASRSRCGSR